MTSGDPRETLSGRDIRPIINRPSAGLSAPVMIALGACLAFGLFLLLDAHRRALIAQRERPVELAGQLPAAPPPLSIPPAPFEPPTTTTVAVPVQAKPPPAPPPIAAAAIARPAPVEYRALPSAIPPPRPSLGNSSNAPLLVVDTTTGSAVAVNEQAAKDPSGAASGDEAVRATLIRNRGSIIPQGTLIAAVLETPLNSTRPGLARAIVAREARSFDGSRILIPRGSRLIGEFKADNGPEQRRVLVTWTRLIRPDGVAIRIGSPAADALGGTGIAGKVNTHFFERFANAVLQSALTIGVGLASQRSGSIYVGVPGQLGTVGQSLLPNVAPRTTIKVREGAEISIFVAHDLDFGGTPPVK